MLFSLFFVSVKRKRYRETGLIRFWQKDEQSGAEAGESDVNGQLLGTACRVPRSSIEEAVQ